MTINPAEKRPASDKTISDNKTISDKELLDKFNKAAPPSDVRHWDDLSGLVPDTAADLLEPAPKSNKNALIKVGAGLTALAAAAGGYFALGNSSDKTPTPKNTSSAAPAVPGGTHTSETVSPSMTETTTTSSPEQAAGASLDELKNKLSSENLAAMTPEQLIAAFKINIDTLDKSKLEESYVNNVMVRVNALYNAAMTEAGNNWNPTSESSDAFTERNLARYAGAINTLYGRPVDAPIDASRSTLSTGYTRYYLLHDFIKNGGSLSHEYSRTATLEPGTLQIVKKGDGVNKPFTVTFGTRVKDTYDMHDEIVKIIGENPLATRLDEQFKDTFVNVAVDADGNLHPESYESNKL